MTRPDELPDFDLQKLIPAHDWCDGKCSRCPLRSDCVLAQLGDDTDEIEPEPRSPWDALRQAGLEYSIALAELVDDPNGETDPAHTEGASAIVRHAAAVIGIKVSHIAELLELEDPDHPVPEYVWDVNLNLLLIQRLDEAAIEAAFLITAATGDAPYEFLLAHGQLFGLLAPLFEAIPTEAREVLEFLIQNRRAPSPFCMMEDDATQLLS